MEILRADFIELEDGLQAEHALVIDDEGFIADLGPADEVIERHKEVPQSVFSGHFVVPGCVNAHSHCFQVLMRGAADHPRNFQDWVESHLYPIVGALDDRAIEIAALLAFAQMARAGTTSLGEFHYIHNDAEQPGGKRIDEIVLAAARRIGLRTTLVRACYDTRRKPGQERFAESPEQAREATLALHEAFKDDALARVIPAPHSLHGASPDMIRAAFAVAEQLDCPYHIHLSEQQSDVPYAWQQYGCSPLEALDTLGVLGQRTVVVHGIWLDAEERALLGRRGGAVVYNPTTNMALGDGIAAIPDLLARGVRVALGTDANYTMSIFAEMRATEYLQRIARLAMGVIAHTSINGKHAPGNARPLLAMGRERGAQVLGLDTGRIAVGQPADLLIIDRNDPSLLPAALHGDDALLNALVSSMVPETAIRFVLVQGQRIVSHNQLVAFANEELAELLAELEAR